MVAGPTSTSAEPHRKAIGSALSVSGWVWIIDEIVASMFYIIVSYFEGVSGSILLVAHSFQQLQLLSIWHKL